MRAILLAFAIAVLGATPAGATLYEIAGRTDGTIPSSKHPRPATDVHLEAQLLTALPDGSLAAVTGWITSLVGIDANGIARPLPGTKHLVEDPADIVPAPAGGVLVSNEEVVQRVAPDGARTTVVPRQCEGATCATPWGLAPRPDGSLLVADTFNDRVLAIAADGTRSTVPVEVHWPFALGLLPDGGFMVAEGKPGHGRVDVGLHVWRVAPDGSATAVAGGGSAAALTACGGTAATPLELDLRHMVDANTGPDGTIYVADRTAGLFALAPDGPPRVLACPPPKLPQRIGDLLPAGLELGSVRLRVRHLAVGGDGTLYIVDGHGRVFADLAPGTPRLALALAGETLLLSRPAGIRVDSGTPRPVPAGSHFVGLDTARVVARQGAAVATAQRRVIRRLTGPVGRRLLRRELRRASRFGAAPRLHRCRAAATMFRCCTPAAAISLRDDGSLDVRRGRRRWLAVP